MNLQRPALVLLPWLNPIIRATFPFLFPGVTNYFPSLPTTQMRVQLQTVIMIMWHSVLPKMHLGSIRQHLRNETRYVDFMATEWFMALPQSKWAKCFLGNLVAFPSKTFWNVNIIRQAIHFATIWKAHFNAQPQWAVHFSLCGTKNNNKVTQRTVSILPEFQTSLPITKCMDSVTVQAR